MMSFKQNLYFCLKQITALYSLKAGTEGKKERFEGYIKSRYCDGVEA